VADEERNVFGALAERGDPDGKNIEAVIEVGTEFVFGDEFGEITVGGSDEARVGF
jgi:hypothetical protein